uniref:Hemagglutinin n=1 Tax=Tenacibaculum sp. Pbs-1 TaxID=3238748 RepID=A0AB33KWL9_9FLAO
MKDILQLVNLQDVDVLALTNPTNELTTIVNRIDSLYQQVQGSTLTQEIITLDTRRDKAISGIKMILNGYENHFNEAIVSAAKTLLATINAHGTNIIRKSYQEQTAILDSISKDFETEPELIQAISLLDLTTWVAELKNANTEFSAKYIERVGETAASPENNIQELRTEASLTYRKLVLHIEAHATLSENEAYPTLLNEVDVLAKQYNLVVDNRSKSSTPTTEEV